MKNNDIILKIVDEDTAQESAAQAISLSVLSTLLWVGGIVNAAQFNKGVRELSDSQQSSLAISKKQIGNLVKQTKKQDADDKIGSYTRAETINIVARTLWSEARGEGEDGLNMVMTVIWNRASGKIERLVDVCFKPLQFSCWNSFTSKSPESYSVEFPKGAMLGGDNLKIWSRCCQLATKAVDGTFTTDKDWDAYYNPNKVKTIKNWMRTLTNKETVGHHIVGKLATSVKKTSSVAKTTTTPKTTTTYVVKKGDTLWGIAKANRISVDKLKSTNGLKSDSLSIGQKLKIG